MGEILAFPCRATACHCSERHLLVGECVVLGQLDRFEGLIQILDDWFALHPQACSPRNQALRALLADTWLLYHIASDGQGRLRLDAHHRIRWAQLQYDTLSDLELMLIVIDNLADVRQGVASLRAAHPPQVRSDLTLFGLEQGIDRLLQQLEKILNAPFVDARRHPEFER